MRVSTFPLQLLKIMFVSSYGLRSGGHRSCKHFNPRPACRRNSSKPNRLIKLFARRHPSRGVELRVEIASWISLRLNTISCGWSLHPRGLHSRSCKIDSSFNAKAESPNTAAMRSTVEEIEQGRPARPALQATRSSRCLISRLFAAARLPARLNCSCRHL